MGPKSDNLDRIEAEEQLEIEGEEMPSPTIQATRAQIEQTRDEMSGTIDAIREKLNTNTQSLADQAKETVSDMATNVMDKAKATVQDVVENAKSSLHDTMQEARTSVHDTLQEAKEALPTITSNAAHHAVSGAVTEAKEAMGSAVSTARHAVEDAADSARDAGATVMGAIQRNPIPAALIALGLGWLWATQRNDRHRKHDWETRRYRAAYGESTWTPNTPSGTYTEGSASRSERFQNVAPSRSDTAPPVSERISEAAERVKESAGDVAHRVQDSVGGAVSTAKHAVGEAAGSARDAGATVMGAIQRNPIPAALIPIGLGWLWATHRGDHDRGSDWETRRARSPYDESTWGPRSYTGADTQGTTARSEHPLNATPSADELSHRVKASVGHAAERVGDTVGQIGSRTSGYARGMAQSCQTMLEERPLALGAIALGVGAAIGMVVPGSYREDRLMGEMRDQLVGKVSDSAQDLAARAQVVAEEALDTAKEEARTQGLAG